MRLEPGESLVDANSTSLFDAVISGACLALFEAVGAPLEPVDVAVGSRDDVGASIGFTGPSLRGALVLISTRHLIQSVLPEAVRGDSAAQVADWTGELANQLLGRIKNKLLNYGVSVDMSTPTVIFGLELARKGTSAGIRRQFAFRHADQPLAIYLDAVAAPGFRLTEPEAPVAPGIAEGDLALF